MSRARDIPEKDVYMPGAVSDKVIAINRLIHITLHLYTYELALAHLDQGESR